MLTYNLGNFMRPLSMPNPAEPWSLTSLCVVPHLRRQRGAPPPSRQMFPDIRSLTARLRAPPAPAWGANDVSCGK